MHLEKLRQNNYNNLSLAQDDKSSCVLTLTLETPSENSQDQRSISLLNK